MKLPFFLAMLEQAVASAGSFITIAILARVLGAEDQGKIGYLYSTYLALSVVNAAVIFQPAAVVVPSVRDAALYLRELALVQLLLAAMTAVLGTIALVFLVRASNAPVMRLEIAAMLIFLFGQQSIDYVRRECYLRHDVRAAFTMSLLVQGGRVLLLLWLWPKSFVLALACLFAVSVIPQLQLLGRAIQVSGKSAVIGRFFAEQSSSAKWLMLGAPLIWLAAAIPVYAVGAWVSLAAAGVFFTVRNLANVANVAMELLETTVSVKAGVLHAEKKPLMSLFKPVYLIGAVLWCFGALAISVFGHEVLALIFGPAYGEQVGLLSIFWLSIGITFLFRLGAVKLRTLGAGKVVTAGYFGSVMVMACLAFPLVTHIGSKGGAWLIVAGVLANLLIQQWLGRGSYHETRWRRE